MISNRWSELINVIENTTAFRDVQTARASISEIANSPLKSCELLPINQRPFKNTAANFSVNCSSALCTRVAGNVATRKISADRRTDLLAPCRNHFLANWFSLAGGFRFSLARWKGARNREKGNSRWFSFELKRFSGRRFELAPRDSFSGCGCSALNPRRILYVRERVPLAGAWLRVQSRKIFFEGNGTLSGEKNDRSSLGRDLVRRATVAMWSSKVLTFLYGIQLFTGFFVGVTTPPIASVNVKWR